MRLNVYGEELTEETEVVIKTAENTGRSYYGLRFFLASPDVLHSDPSDDDRSAVTLWVPWTKRGTHDVEKLRRLLVNMLNRLDEIVLVDDSLDPEVPSTP